MALFRNLGVKPRGSLCDVLQYVSVRPGGIFIDFAKNSRFMNWKPVVPTTKVMIGANYELIAGRTSLWT